ncbi:hypothetical protein D3C87_1207160 [compost metagenome]
MQYIIQYSNENPKDKIVLVGGAASSILINGYLQIPMPNIENYDFHIESQSSFIGVIEKVKKILHPNAKGYVQGFEYKGSSTVATLGREISYSRSGIIHFTNTGDLDIIIHVNMYDIESQMISINYSEIIHEISIQTIISLYNYYKRMISYKTEEYNYLSSLQDKNLNEISLCKIKLDRFVNRVSIMKKIFK